MIATRSLLLACAALLGAACSRTPDAVPAPPTAPESAATPAVPPPVAPTPAVAAAPTSAAPTSAAAATATPIPEPERALYDLVVRLAREPDAQKELAPKATLVRLGGPKAKRPLTDARAALGWIADSSVKLVTASSRADEITESVIACNADKLRCVISQPGGETVLLFARTGDRIVLKQVESEE